MPCSDNGPPPHLRRTAQVYKTLYETLHPSMLPPVNQAILNDADDVWCQTDHAAVVCATLRNMSPDSWEDLEYQLPFKREVRDLYNWWEDHQKLDEYRK